MKRYFTQFFLILFTVFFLTPTALAAPLEGTAGTEGTSGSGGTSVGPLSTGSACTYTSTNCPSGNTTCLAISCSSGYCVHGICRTASTYCGDGYCDSGETCSGCSSDCGSCPTAAAPTGGGGEAVVETTKTVSILPATPAVVTIETAKAKDLKIDEVTVSVKEAVSNVQVTVKESSLPSGASVPVAAAVGSTYKYIDVSTTIEPAKLEKVKIKFKVEKSWITSNTIDEEKVVLNRYADNKWNKLTTTKSSSDATYIYYEAESPGLSVFAITGEKKAAVTPPVEEKKCPVCPQPSGWIDCTANKQSRTNYKCSAETNYTCQSYTEEQTCEVVAPPIKIPKTWIFIILATIFFLVFYQFRKGKAKLRFKPKKKK